MGNRTNRRMTLAVKKKLVAEDHVFCTFARKVIQITTCIINQSMPCIKCIGCANYGGK